MARSHGGNSWQPELKCLWSTSCNNAIKSVVLSSRGKLAAATDSCIFVFDGPPAFSCKQQLRPQSAGLTAIAFSHKGADVVSGGADGFLKWWQIDTGAETCSTPFTTADAQPQQQQLSIPEVACSKAGFIAAVSGGLLCIFGPGGEHLHTVGDEAKGQQLQHMVWLDDSHISAACGSEIMVWRVSNESCEESGMLGANPTGTIVSMAPSPSGRYLAAACNNGTVQLWQLADGSGLNPVLCLADSTEGPLRQLSWDSSGQYLAAAAGNAVLVWDVAAALDGKTDPIVCIGYDETATVKFVAFQPNSTLLATAADDGQCLVYDMDSFSAGNNADSLVAHVASSRLAPDTPASITALAWHTAGALILGTSAGMLLALQPLRAGPSRTFSLPTAGEASRSRQTDQRREGDAGQEQPSGRSNGRRRGGGGQQGHPADEGRRDHGDGMTGDARHLANGVGVPPVALELGYGGRQRGGRGRPDQGSGPPSNTRPWAHGKPPPRIAPNVNPPAGPGPGPMPPHMMAHGEGMHPMAGPVPPHRMPYRAQQQQQQHMQYGPRQPPPQQQPQQPPQQQQQQQQQSHSRGPGGAGGGKGQGQGPGGPAGAASPAGLPVGAAGPGGPAPPPRPAPPAGVPMQVPMPVPPGAPGMAMPMGYEMMGWQMMNNYYRAVPMAQVAYPGMPGMPMAPGAAAAGPGQYVQAGMHMPPPHMHAPSSRPAGGTARSSEQGPHAAAGGSGSSGGGGGPPKGQPHSGTPSSSNAQPAAAAAAPGGPRPQAGQQQQEEARPDWQQGGRSSLDGNSSSSNGQGQGQGQPGPSGSTRAELNTGSSAPVSRAAYRRDRDGPRGPNGSYSSSSGSGSGNGSGSGSGGVAPRRPSAGASQQQQQQQPAGSGSSGSRAAEGPPTEAVGASDRPAPEGPAAAPQPPPSGGSGGGAAGAAGPGEGASPAGPPPPTPAAAAAAGAAGAAGTGPAAAGAGGAGKGPGGSGPRGNREGRAGAERRGSGGPSAGPGIAERGAGGGGSMSSPHVGPPGRADRQNSLGRTHSISSTASSSRFARGEPGSAHSMQSVASPVGHMPMGMAHSPYMQAMVPGAGGMTVPVVMYSPHAAPWCMAAYPQQWNGAPVYGFYPAPYGGPPGMPPSPGAATEFGPPALPAGPPAPRPQGPRAAPGHQQKPGHDHEGDAQQQQQQQLAEGPNTGGGSSSSSGVPPPAAGPGGGPHLGPGGMGPRGPPPGPPGSPPPLVLYVGGLTTGVEDDALHAAFVPFGHLVRAQVIRNPDGSSRCYGFVTYSHPDAAQAAMAAMNGARLGGPFDSRALRVTPSYKGEAPRAPGPRGPRPPIA